MSSAGALYDIPFSPMRSFYMHVLSRPLAHAFSKWQIYVLIIPRPALKPVSGQGRVRLLACHQHG